MGKLELFLHDQPIPTSILLKAALMHVQFETIHPFLDGNGRLGRLLITLLLCEQKVLRDPMLYLSLYLKNHRQQYYELLNAVRLTGNWEAWLDFFADAVIATADQAVETAQKLYTLSINDMKKISKIGQAATSTLKVYEYMKESIYSTSNILIKKTSLSAATVNRSLSHLIKLDIVHEITRQKRNRLFRYSKYMEILDQGTELPVQ